MSHTYQGSCTRNRVVLSEPHTTIRQTMKFYTSMDRSFQVNSKLTKTSSKRSKEMIPHRWIISKDQQVINRNIDHATTNGIRGVKLNKLLRVGRSMKTSINRENPNHLITKQTITLTQTIQSMENSHITTSQRMRKVRWHPQE